jgi:hypothetical protein
MTAPAPQHTLTMVVSPYHLTTRELPAMCALLLADQVVTLMPVPQAGTSREDIAEAVERSPRYLRFMESWRWTIPLWQAGVVASSYRGDEVSCELAGLHHRLSVEEELAPLRSLMQKQCGATPEELLDAVSADILKGGPDPGINIPIAAAIDAFAVRHGLPVARSAATSIAQRAEARLGRRLFTFAAPVVLRASGARMMELRARLLPELGALRERLGSALRGACERNGEVGASACAPAPLGEAARALGRAFDAAGPLISGDDDEGRRVMHGYASITAAAVPEDVVLRSSLAAVRAVGRAEAGAAAPPIPVGAAQGPATGVSPRRLTVLVMKEMTVRPED